jgi:hypothetical protein
MTGSLNTGRDDCEEVLLPNGKVLVIGGGDYFGLFTSTELYDPATGTWTTNAPMNIARDIFTATLLPDGCVLIAGGFANGTVAPLTSAEIYNGGLGYSNSWQPKITAINSSLNPGCSLTIRGGQFGGIAEGSDGNTQASSANYPLVQLRSLESGQTRFLWTTNWTTNSFASTAVWNFPPGWALATVFVNGIQSTSAMVNIAVPIPTTTTLSRVGFNSGQFHFSFTNASNALLGILATTNLSVPQTNWTALGGVTEIAPGQFQFTDPQTTNEVQRYYRLYAP